MLNAVSDENFTFMKGRELSQPTLLRTTRDTSLALSQPPLLKTAYRQLIPLLVHGARAGERFATQWNKKFNERVYLLILLLLLVPLQSLPFADLQWQ